MKLFGSLSEIVGLVFRKNSQSITLRPNQATTYTASRDVQLPPQDAAGVLVSADSSQVLTNKTLTGNVAGSFSNTGIVTLPTATTTLVGRDTTDQGASRLKNKDLEGDTTFIVDDVDTTKKFRIDVGLATTATTTNLLPTSTVNRSINLPDAADTLVGKATTDTFTNKTISGATNTLTNIPAATAITGQLPTANGGTGQNSTATFPTSGVVVTEAGTEALTNKDYNGGTASNSSRVTLPKNTTTNLTALTRKQGTLLYDSTLDVVKYDNGSTLSTLASAGTASPTALGTVTSYFPVIQSSVNAVSSADYTITTTDGYGHIAVSTGNSNRTVTLPDAAANVGRTILITKTDTGTGFILITRAGSDTIEGATVQYVMAQYDRTMLVSTGGIDWLLVEAAPDYESNSDDQDAADTTSFASGPAGSSGVIGVRTLTATRRKRVRFKTNILATDVLLVEVDPTGAGRWFPVGQSTLSNGDGIDAYHVQNATTYGASMNQVNSTDIDVVFGRYAISNGATFSLAGKDWSSADFSGGKFRVVKRRK